MNKGGAFVSSVRMEPAVLSPLNLYVRHSTAHFAVIIIAGDIELNPGPTRFPCGQCGRAVKSNNRGVCCDQCNKWYHVRCARVAN